MCDTLIQAARQLSRSVDTIQFSPPVTYVYNPLHYAWPAHEQYLQHWGTGPRRVVFLGMNPGPWGMVQTGVPFGDVGMVRDWLGLEASVAKPPDEHPARPVQGWDCPRGEVSGQRLWGLFAARFGNPERFFRHHFVANYCPLAFMEASGRNRTPDKLSPTERARLLPVCDEHLRAVCRVLKPEYLVGVGRFACMRARTALKDVQVTVVQVLHPSPASPRANQGWAEQATRQLVDLGIW